MSNLDQDFFYRMLNVILSFPILFYDVLLPDPLNLYSYLSHLLHLLWLTSQTVHTFLYTLDFIKVALFLAGVTLIIIFE